MKTFRRLRRTNLLFLAVMPAVLAILRGADGASPRADADGGHVRRLIAEERWNEVMKLAPTASQVPGQRNTAEALIQTNLPILIDWDSCAPKSAVQDVETQRPKIYRYPWMEFYSSSDGTTPDGLWAALHLQYSSWPKTAWRVTLRRLDRAGDSANYHRTLETLHENSGTIERVPSVENATLKWQVGEHPEVAADPGRLFQIGLETLWTEQGNPVRWDEEMPLSLDLGSLEYSKVFRAQWLKLEKVDGKVQATVLARIMSWPRNQWRLTLTLFDHNGSQVGRGTTTAENSGVILGDPLLSQESLRFNIAGAREAKESAQRYTLRIEHVAVGHERQAASARSESVTNAASPSQLAGLIADTTWEWGNGGERIQFNKDGWIDHPGWYQRGLATSWNVIDEHTVLLTIVEGREVDRLAILVFNPDFTEYTGYSFHGAETFMPCKRVQGGAKDTGSENTTHESQFDRSGPRTYRPVSGRSFHPVLAEATNQSSYPWVVFGRVTDSKSNGMSNVHVSASCGWGSLWPTASTNSDAQGDYRLVFGPGLVWKDATGRVDVAKTVERTGFQKAIIHASKSGYYEKDLGRQGDLLMGRDLPRRGPPPGIATDRIVLPNQPKRVDFVMLPAASISGRVVAANGKSTQGRRFYVGADKLPPGASVLCEFRPDAVGGFKIGGVPCQSYWFEPADGNLAGVRSNPLAISRAGKYEVELSINDADRKLTARIVTAPAASTGD